MILDDEHYLEANNFYFYFLKFYFIIGSRRVPVILTIWQPQ